MPELQTPQDFKEEVVGLIRTTRLLDRPQHKDDIKEILVWGVKINATFVNNIRPNQSNHVL